MRKIFNQTSQPVELSNGIVLGADDSREVETVGAREEMLQKRGIVSIVEIKPNVTESDQTTAEPARAEAKPAKKNEKTNG